MSTTPLWRVPRIRVGFEDTGLAIAHTTRAAALGDTLALAIRADGTAGLDYPRRLLRRDTALRDLADAVHALVGVHAAHPGAVEAAHERWPGMLPDAWLDTAATGFRDERAYLVTLCSAIGPVPSTPGQAESLAAFAGQRAAFATLVGSDRPGCAIGAALALVLDWQAIRPVLDAGARRVGFTAPMTTLPNADTAEAALATLASGGIERATLFGATQALAQQRGLWDLLEARASARDAT